MAISGQWWLLLIIIIHDYFIFFLADCWLRLRNLKSPASYGDGAHRMFQAMLNELGRTPPKRQAWLQLVLDVCSFIRLTTGTTEQTWGSSRGLRGFLWGSVQESWVCTDAPAWLKCVEIIQLDSSGGDFSIGFTNQFPYKMFQHDTQWFTPTLCIPLRPCASLCYVLLCMFRLPSGPFSTLAAPSFSVL